MNSSGTPCTLSRVIDPETGKLTSVPRLEEVEPERETFESEVKAATEKIAAKTKEALSTLASVMEGKTVKKGDLKQVKDLLASAHQDITANLPFIQQSFYEAMEGVTSKVKTELYATAESIVRERGLAGTHELMGEGSLKQLGERTPAVGWPDGTGNEESEEDQDWVDDGDED